MLLFYVRTACELWLANKATKHAWRWLSRTKLRAYLQHKTKPLVVTTLPHAKGLLYYRRRSFSTYNCIRTLTSELGHQTPMAMAFSYDIVRTSSTIRNHWQLRHYHIPNDSSTNKDASFYIESNRKVSVYKLQSRAQIFDSMILPEHMWRIRIIRQQTYDCTTHRTTITLPTIYLLYKYRNKLQLTV